MDDTVRVWDAHDKEITGTVEPWDSWEKIKEANGFPGGLIAMLKAHQDSEGCGFNRPTIVQAYAWPVLQSQGDLVGVAKTGSGKTLAFLLPGFIRLRRLKKSKEIDTSIGPGLLTMTPTRELCNQIYEDANKFGRHVDITAACAYGGAPKNDQIWRIKEGPDCLIATPGRLNDFCNTNVVNLTQARFVVLDEADRMLDLGFEPQIKEILTRCHYEKQTCMFTATWPREIRELSRNYIKSPTQIMIGSGDVTTNKNIFQKIMIMSDNNQKKEELTNILRGLAEGGNCLVFCNTKKGCTNLAWELNQDRSLGLWTVELHGDLDQAQRDKSLNSFKKGEARVLCATDLASRGLDIRCIAVVVNWDCPRYQHEYVHRIGRTGRAEDIGEAITFMNPWNDQKNAQFIIETMEQAEQVVPQELRDLVDGKFVASDGGGGGGWGGGNDWQKKDDWQKSSSQDSSWQKDDWKQNDWKNSSAGNASQNDSDWKKKDWNDSSAEPTAAWKEDEAWESGAPQEDVEEDWKKAPQEEPSDETLGLDDNKEINGKALWGLLQGDSADAAADDPPAKKPRLVDDEVDVMAEPLADEEFADVGADEGALDNLE